MKKYIVAIMIVFIPCVTYALTMCARDNSLVITLQAAIPGSSPASKAEDWAWRVNFNYGTLLGEATCLNPSNGHPNNDTITGVIVRNDGTNVPNDFPKGMQGSNNFFCWCRISHPINTIWVFSTRFDNGGLCKNNCAYYCATNVAAQSTAMRSSMFKNIVK